jgi:hypothetical protein
MPCLRRRRHSSSNCKLFEVLAAHNIRPEEALILIGVNVSKAKREAKSEQVNKAPRFFRT